jgi:adenosylcobinamide-GDP ribazoletransferase
MRALVTAFRTLTSLPVPGPDAPSLASALPFFPVVGMAIGASVTAVLYGMHQAGWVAGGSVLATIVVLLLTRGLHVDGLADVSDALGAGRTVERRLRIMKDPHLGAFGVMAIIGDLLLKTVAMDQLATLRQWSLLVLPFIVSRAILVVPAASLPYARPEGGKAAPFVADARPRHLVAGVVTGMVLCVAIAGLAGALLMLQGLVIAVVLRLWMRHAFGGVTGDLLGFSNEVVETGLLTFAAAIAVAGPTP